MRNQDIFEKSQEVIIYSRATYINAKLLHLNLLASFSTTHNLHFHFICIVYSVRSLLNWELNRVLQYTKRCR